MNQEPFTNTDTVYSCVEILDLARLIAQEDIEHHYKSLANRSTLSNVEAILKKVLSRHLQHALPATHIQNDAAWADARYEAFSKQDNPEALDYEIAANALHIVLERLDDLVPVPAATLPGQHINHPKIFADMLFPPEAAPVSPIQTEPAGLPRLPTSPHEKSLLSPVRSSTVAPRVTAPCKPRIQDSALAKIRTKKESPVLPAQPREDFTAINQAILTLVSDHYEASPEALLSKDELHSPGHYGKNAGRHVAMYLIHTTTPQSLRKIGSMFGGISAPGVLTCCRRLEKHRLQDAELNAVIERLAGEVPSAMHQGEQPVLAHSR